MAEIRKIIKVFLASPGDLEDERKAIRDVVSEFNETWADGFSYQVVLLGWEETVASFGRPQHIRNQEVDRCELFIGMLWKRWGTPPDKNGVYTSGFHEEYERCISRCKKTGKPEISLFFKEVDNTLLTDPGADLQKVLKFKQDVIAKKEILFQRFTDKQDIEGLVRRCISKYVMMRISEEEEKVEDTEVSKKQSKVSNNIGATTETADMSSPFSSEGYSFLEDFVGKIRYDKEIKSISPCDIARFRLLANSISKSGNHDKQLGVHDFNIIYVNRNQINFCHRELYTLMRFGLQCIQHENAPFWYWYSKQKTPKINTLSTSAFVGDNDAEKIGAIKVLNLLNYKMTDSEHFGREAVINSWFKDKSSSEIKNAGLEYLANNGFIQDFKIAKEEYDRNDYSTSSIALESMIKILYRNGEKLKLINLVLKVQFDSLSPILLSKILESFKIIESDKLCEGLEHRNSKVRLKILKILNSRKEISNESLEKLTQDSDSTRIET